MAPTPTPQNGPYLWKSCECISYYLSIIPPCMYATISIIKHFAISENEGQGGGQRPFGIFPKIHPIWQPDPSLRHDPMDQNDNLPETISTVVILGHNVKYLGGPSTLIFQKLFQFRTLEHISVSSFSAFRALNMQQYMFCKLEHYGCTGGFLPKSLPVMVHRPRNVLKLF